MGSKPSPRNAAYCDAECDNDAYELDIVKDDGAVAISQRLHQPNLFALQCHKPAEREIHKKRRDQEEDWRQRPAHVAQHVELVVDPCVGGLIFPAVSGPSAISVEQCVELGNYVPLRGIAQE